MHNLLIPLYKIKVERFVIGRPQVCDKEDQYEIGRKAYLAEGRVEGEVDVLVRVHTHQEGRHVHHLPAHPVRHKYIKRKSGSEACGLR